jgi:hypothetical protein
VIRARFPARTAVLLALFPVHADPMDPPDIHTQTLQEYAAMAEIPAESAIRRSVYLDSLAGELQRLYLEVDSLLTPMPDMRQRFGETHGLFLSWADSWSWFLEDIQWRDPETGEPVFGSLCGETRIQVAAALYWERILLYRAFAEGGLQGGFGETTVPSDRIGGY